MPATRLDKHLDTEAMEFVKKNPLATLITSYHNRPHASHVPFIVVSTEESLILVSFLRKSNKQWKHLEFEDVLAIFQGESPQSLEESRTKEEYKQKGKGAFHLYGHCNIIHEREAAKSLYMQLLEEIDPVLHDKWLKSSPDRMEGVIDNIMVFEFKVESIHPVKPQHNCLIDASDN
ncbi:MAG: FMN-binding negative transcriptional regulator [Saprospiraceae bacterium]|nr:FMN-binding negative transcriptional regulator [Saprospiraceae bacterium]